MKRAGTRNMCFFLLGLMQTVSGTVTEFRFVLDVIAKDGNSFLLLCLKGKCLVSTKR